MRQVIMLLTVLVALAPLTTPVSAQTPPRGDRERMEAMQQQRAQLERQVRQRFLAQAAERLSLDAGQRQRLDDLLDRGAEARRALARESRQLRGELVRTVADGDAPQATYQRLLQGLRELSAREHALEQREAAALAEFLDARQQAQFLVLRMQLSERVRGMRGDGPGGPPGVAPTDRPRDQRRRPDG
jgi:hypothetical protein